MTIAIDTAVGTAKEALGSAKEALGSAKDVADTAAGAVSHAAGAVSHSATDAAKNIRKAVMFLRDIGADDILGLVGLKRKTSPLASLALVGGGVILGAGLALLIAPASGREARAQIRKFFAGYGGRAADEVKEKAQEVAGEVKERVGDVKERAQDLAGEVKERVGDVKERAQDLAGEVKERVGDKVGQVQEKATEALGRDEDEGTEERKGGRRRNHQAQVS
jgi:gas vesicle protein